LLYKGAVRDQNHCSYQGLSQPTRGMVREEALVIGKVSHAGVQAHLRAAVAQKMEALS